MKKIIHTNKKAFHNFFIIETYEAGIVLTGNEVKSCCTGNVNFQDSFATIENNKIVLHNSFIARYNNGSYHFSDCYQDGTPKAQNEKTNRFLLLRKQEMRRIVQKMQGKDFCLIPISMYFSKTGKIKIELAIAKGKHNYDKRESLKEKQLELDLKKII